MKIPISEILDRYSIALLKNRRVSADNEEEIVALMRELSTYDASIINDYTEKLLSVNGKIWDLESDIRKGKEGELGLEEVGRRAIAIRDLNRIRVTYKNELVSIFNEGYKDIKINHASAG